MNYRNRIAPCEGRVTLALVRRDQPVDIAKTVQQSNWHLGEKYREPDCTTCERGVGTKSRKSPAARRGSSLVEVAISCVLVGVMMVASMRTVGAVFRTRLVASQQQDGKSLAHELMAEILQTYHEEPSLPEGSIGLDSGETGDGSRALWDDVDDYNGWSASPPEFKDGTALPDATGWTRQVVVDRVTCPAPETASGSDTGLKRIQVTATSPTSQTFTIYALRSRWGVMELKPPLDTTYVTGLSGELQASATSDTVVGGTAVTNHAEGP